MPLDPRNNTERAAELPWLFARLEQIGPVRSLLDVGHAGADYAPELLATGAAVTLQDVRPFIPRHLPPDARYATFVGGVPWPVAWGTAFDLVTCISVLDHVGLDAYGQPADATALPRLVSELWRVTAPGGRLLLTVPVGRDLWTTHPGGGQRVFSRAALWEALGIETCWRVAGCDLYRLLDGTYEAVGGWDAVAHAAYLDYRAEAVACLELRKPA